MPPRWRGHVATTAVLLFACVTWGGGLSAQVENAPDSMLRRSSTGVGAVPEAHSTGTSIHVDQDLFLAKPTDQFYTMGGLIAKSGVWVTQAHLEWPLKLLGKSQVIRKIRDVALASRDKAEQRYESHTFQFGVSAFTPQKGFHYDPVQQKVVFGDSLRDTVPHFHDRPSPAFNGPERRPHAWGGIYISFLPPI